MVKEIKQNCYNCEYRGRVAGDAHSCCKYPGTSTGMFDIFNSKNFEIAKELNIQGVEHGVRSGWFLWPVNFDPVWLENCDGHKLKESNV